MQFRLHFSCNKFNQICNNYRRFSVYIVYYWQNMPLTQKTIRKMLKIGTRARLKHLMYINNVFKITFYLVNTSNYRSLFNLINSYQYQMIRYLDVLNTFCARKLRFLFELKLVFCIVYESTNYHCFNVNKWQRLKSNAAKNACTNKI